MKRADMEKELEQKITDLKASADDSDILITELEFTIRLEKNKREIALHDLEISRNLFNDYTSEVVEKRPSY